jgi:Rps23 Pro-64 3,4-dihydroxylase Tpa1-like proline 4-hydroxylase
MYGDWINKINYYKEEYKNAKPFEHIIINNFFSSDYINKIYEKYPKIDNKWCYYNNPIEHKYSLNKFDDNKEINELFEKLNGNEFINILKQITDINDLEKDEYLHGAGLHAYPNKGKLDIHLDYNIHPITGKERRINLIIYINKDWKEEYGGNLELYDEDKNEGKIKLFPKFNTAILFKTCDMSYHGLPTPIKCPEGKYRKSIAIYYVSSARENLTKRFKAEYFPKLEQPVNEKLLKLYKIRKERLINDEDLSDWTNWKNEGNGYW